MNGSTAKRPRPLDSRSTKPRFGPRLLAACVGTAVLPAVLVLLAMNGIGTERVYWAATAVAFVLLGAWPFAARRRAGAERSGVLLVGITTALLLGFLVGSVFATVGVSIWRPATGVAQPGGGV